MTIPIKATSRGYRTASPAERASFGMLASFAVTVATGRAVNYLREQRRPAPRWRSWARQTRHAPGKNRPRVHHFLPGIGIAFAAGGAAILTRNKGGEHWFSLPFGAGVALPSDEIDLLIELDNPYWGSESSALIQAAAAALAAATLAARFHHHGSHKAKRPRRRVQPFAAC